MRYFSLVTRGLTVGAVFQSGDSWTDWGGAVFQLSTDWRAAARAVMDGWSSGGAAPAQTGSTSVQETGTHLMPRWSAKASDSGGLDTVTGPFFW